MNIRRYTTILGIVMLALMFFLAGGAALRESVTFDEVAHIGAGVSYLQRLDLRLNPEHPPLAKILAAIPLVARGIHADYASIIWQVSDDPRRASTTQWIFGETILTRWNDPKTTLAWARFPMLLLTIATGWLVFVYARRLGGNPGGLLCLTLYISTPTFLAFGPLVLTDMAVAFFSLLAIWAAGDLWAHSDGKNTLRLAASLAGACLSKFNAPILFLAVVALPLSTIWRALPAQPDEGPWRRYRAMAIAAGWTGVAVYVVYFILGIHQPLAVPGLSSGDLLSATLGRALMPFLVVMRGLHWVLASGDRPTFLLGQVHPHGVWFYFPVLLVLKSPPGFVALLLTTPALAWIGKRFDCRMTIPAEFAPHWRTLWISVLLFSGICVASRFNVSIRHFTIPMVLLILMMAPLPRLLGSLRAQIPNFARIATVAVILLATSCLISAVWSYPFYFSYITPLAAKAPPYWLTSDSNIDWNQALPEVAGFARQHELQDVPIDTYGVTDTTPWVPQSRLWDCQAPTEKDAGQWVFVSGSVILDGHNCGWLMQYPHEPLAGGSMYAVRLPGSIPPAGSPGGPPIATARRFLFGMPFDMRALIQVLGRHPELIPRVLMDSRARN